MSRVVQRDPSSSDGGAQNARDNVAFDGNKVAQALAVAQRAEQQAQEVARMVSKSQSQTNERLDGFSASIDALKSAGAARSSAAQAFVESTNDQLSKFRAEMGVIGQKVTSILPLADSLQAQVLCCHNRILCVSSSCCAATTVFCDVVYQSTMVKSMRGSIDSMRDTLNTLNFASKEARQVTFSYTTLSPFPPGSPSHKISIIPSSSGDQQPYICSQHPHFLHRRHCRPTIRAYIPASRCSQARGGPERQGRQRRCRYEGHIYVHQVCSHILYFVSCSHVCRDPCACADNSAS